MSGESGSERSGDAVSAALLQVLFDQGWDASRNPARLRAMMNDVLGSASNENRAPVDALIVGAQQGIPAGMTAALAEPGSTLSAEQQGEFESSLTGWGMDRPIATWVVASWAWAYREMAEAAPSTDLPTVTGLAAVPTATTEAGPGSTDETWYPFAFSAPHSTPPPTILPIAAGLGVAGASAVGLGAARDSGAAAAGGIGGSAAGSGSHAPLLSKGRLAAVAAACALLLIGGTAWAVVGTGGSSPKQGLALISAPGTSSASATSPKASASKSSPKPSPSKAKPKPTTKPKPKPKAPATSKTANPPPAATVTYTYTPPVASTAPPVAPTKTVPKAPVATTPKPKPPVVAPPAAPIAYSFSAAPYTPLFANGAFYGANVPASVKGNYNTLTVTGGSSSNAKVYSTAGKVGWTPIYNGQYSFQIYYYVTNTATGLRSNTATVTVTVLCNSNLPCGAPPPPF